MSGPTRNAHHKDATRKLGTLIRELREMRGWSVPRLADEADLTTDPIYGLEAHRSKYPTLVTIAKIARAFDFRASELLDDVGL